MFNQEIVEIVLKEDTTMINKDMLVGQVLKEYPETADVFRALGMHCLGCPSSSGESLEDACTIHGIDVDKLVDELNAYLESKQK